MINRIDQATGPRLYGDPFKMIHKWKYKTNGWMPHWENDTELSQILDERFNHILIPLLQMIKDKTHITKQLKLF